MYSTLQEDVKLRKSETLNECLPDTKQLQVYMHVNTDVPLTNPNDPDLQKALFSEYYGGSTKEGIASIMWLD